MRIHTSRALCVIGAAAMVSGCTVPGREVFATSPTPPGPAERATLPRTTASVALITVRFAVASPGYARAIADAVRAAEARRPGLRYLIVLVTPSVTEPALDVGTRDALAVARAVAGTGVAAGRIGLSGEVDRALPAREIRVFAGA